MNHILSSVALTAIPVAALGAADTQAATTIEELAEQFRESAQALDPRIQECWIGYDELAKGPRDMRVMSIYFGRKDTPFLRPTQPKPATITDLFEQWRDVRVDPTGETEAEAQGRHYRYAQLQDKITSMRPRSIREAAMQFVVETDDGESEYRKEFYVRLRLMAMGEDLEHDEHGA